MSDLKGLKIKRGGLKSQLTRFKNFLNSREEFNLTELSTRLDKITPILNEFQEVLFQIEGLQDSSLEIENDGELEEFESSYFSLVAKARDILQPRLLQDDNTADNNRSDSNLNLSGSPTVAKLPQIPLPSFQGGCEFYFSFKEQFNSLVDQRRDLDDVQKFCYLRAALKGEALGVIASLETISKNYSKAWDLLDQRFHNKRLVVGKHLRELFDTEKIDRESAVKLRKFVDHVLKHFRALESLDLPVEHWDAPLVFYLQQKLDPKTLREWEGTCNKTTIPDFNDFMNFLQTQAQILEVLEGPKEKFDKTKNSSSHFKQSSDRHISSHLSASTVAQTSNIVSNTSNRPQDCPACNYRHKIFYCRKFLSLSVPERLKIVEKAHLCSNCLRDGSNHTVEECQRPHCKHCDVKHNSLLHRTNPSSGSTHTKRGSTSSQAAQEISLSSTATQDTASTVLLSTAVVKVFDRYDIPHNCRVLLDSGSQLNFISEKMSQILGHSSFRKSSSICGIGGSRSSGHRGIRCQIQSQDGSFKANLECIVMPKITLDLPTTPVNISQWNLPSHLTLADPGFFKKSSIHMLIGAAEFFNIMGSSQISLGIGFPTLQNTKLGWVVSGKVSLPTGSDSVVNHQLEVGCSLALEECIRQFWEIEDISAPRKFNPDEQICEEIFLNTTTRDKCGRFEVHFPVKTSIGLLGDNKETALKRFFSLEKKLAKNPSLRESYISFMREYISLAHMTPVLDESEPSLVYYIPHHCVLNEYSSTTRLRVVFDASCKSISGLSLNDVLMVGPTVQEDLTSILMRFRKHKYVMTADITKMYRQVNVCEEHRVLQRIFWRDSPNDKLQVFNLNTVTYGTGPAAFLSTRCLKELAIQAHSQFPEGSNAVARDFYVDDYLGGSESLEEALALQNQVIAITASGQFVLHKWCANHPLLIQNIPPESRETKYEVNPLNQVAIKTLGVWWNPSSDLFSFSINVSDDQIITKRSILSEVARIFDPLGLLGPIILEAKLFLKQLWIEKVDWDTPLDSALRDNWIDFREQLKSLETLGIPRQVNQNSGAPVEIHGFSDASEQAYGASIYLRSQDGVGEYFVELLCSKSRVAPVKTISIPRLELCGALILARLVRKCIESLTLPDVSCHLWTDSTVTLAWISQPSAAWKTFVSNRVSEIHSLTKEFQWHHVPSSDNPSDLLSRGLKPGEISQSRLWWQGPSWLSESHETWPVQPLLPVSVPDTKFCGAGLEDTGKVVIDFCRFSNFHRLVNSTAYSLRFIDQFSNKACFTGPISTEETERALRQLIKVVQRETFRKDLARLQQNQSVSKKGPLSALCPFLDKEGIIRVGGRLKNSNLEYEQRHQIVLPAKHQFTFLLIKYFHHKNLHAGPQLLLASIRQQYWPIQGKGIIRKIFHSCITCFRHQPRSVAQIMGDLPGVRVQPARPFINSGVDFCGPLLIKSGTLRRSKSVKAYAALFICLATKSIHIELVSDLSTPAFINALKRFFARRGKARNMYSDNGTNFVGASRELNEYVANALKDPSLKNYTASEQVNWHFIPPRTPHMGGIWESSIKSLKFHLKRVIGGALLTFEEMTTVLTMVEACLNSRPLLPLSDNPNDLSALTPGHFLVGDALTALVEPDLKPYKEGSLKRWARLQKMYQHFWDRWSNEYLSTLQSRQKWNSKQPNLPVGGLVLIKEDNIPPLKWHLGRITAVHPGIDGCVRVATVKTTDGVFKRHVTKLCPLPNFEEASTNEEK